MSKVKTRPRGLPAFGSTLSQPMLDSTFGPAPTDERQHRVRGALSLRLGEDNSEDKEPGVTFCGLGGEKNFRAWIKFYWR